MPAARQLNGQDGAVLIDAGRGEFIDALRLGAGISGVGSIALAAFVVVTLRHVKRSREAAA